MTKSTGQRVLRKLGIDWSDDDARKAYHREYNRVWQENNREKCREKCRSYEARNKEARNARCLLYRQQNIEVLREHDRNWHAANPDCGREAARRWAKNNPGAKKAADAKRRRGAVMRTPPWADLGAIKLFYERCPTGYEVDHIIPLFGKIVSGLHVLKNLQYLTSSENRSKSNRFAILSEAFDD